MAPLLEFVLRVLRIVSCTPKLPPELGVTQKKKHFLRVSQPKPKPKAGKMYETLRL